MPTVVSDSGHGDTREIGRSSWDSAIGPNGTREVSDHCLIMLRISVADGEAGDQSDDELMRVKLRPAPTS